MKVIGYKSKAEWLIPAALIVLSLVPAVAGTFRLVELTGGAEITPDNARFFAAPLPVVLQPPRFRTWIRTWEPIAIMCYTFA